MIEVGFAFGSFSFPFSFISLSFFFVALIGGGFRDTTRIASGSPEMWRDIALTNRAFLARTLGVFIEDLQEIQRSLNDGDTTAIEEFFNQAKLRRDSWLGSSQPPTA